MTERNLREAFACESQAHLKYQLYANKAEEEGMPNIARLFRAISFAEFVHASNHLQALGEIKKTSENLKDAITSENFEIEEMYPAFDSVAKLQEERNVVQSINYAIEAEIPHSAMFSDALQLVMKDKDFVGETISICPNCGYTQHGEINEDCKICGNLKENLKLF